MDKLTKDNIRIGMKIMRGSLYTTIISFSRNDNIMKVVSGLNFPIENEYVDAWEITFIPNDCS